MQVIKVKLFNLFYLCLKAVKNRNQKRKSLFRCIYERFLVKYLKPERSFTLELDRNPFYPFVQTNSFECEFIYPRSFIQITLYVFLIVLATRYSFIDGVNTFKESTLPKLFIEVLKILLKFIILTSISFNLIRKPILDLFFERKLIIRQTESSYSFYLSGELYACHGLENLYLRIDAKYVLRNNIIYNLVVSGKDIETFEINSETYDLSRIRKLGRQLAYNLGINFFDVDDKSLHHEIIFRKHL